MLPEELTRMSHKELEKVLTPDPFKAKYFIVNNNSEKIYKAINTKIGKIIEIPYGETLNDRIYGWDNKGVMLLKYSDLKNSYLKPLTPELILKSKNVEDYVRKMSQDNFANYVVNILNICYSKENIDIQIEKNGITNIILYIPEITIINSLGLDHIMRDIYLKFEFRNNIFFRMSIRRTTFYSIECYYDYVYSHVNANWGSWSSNFCFGSTDYAQTYSKITKSISLFAQEFPQFVAGLNNYLSWESIEGRPHRNMSNLFLNSSDSSASAPYYDFNHLYVLFMNNITAIKYKYDITSTGAYSIKLEDSWKEELHKEITKYIDKKLIFEYSNGKSFTTGINLERYIQYNGKDSGVIFKGNKIKYKITHLREVSSEKRLHIDIFNKLVLKIEQELEDFIIKKLYN